MIPRSSKPLKRTPVKKRNVKRRASEFKRCYGSKERVAFIRGLPCAACGVVGYSENAHLLGNGGTGRKADAGTIGPLCAPHLVVDVRAWDRSEVMAIGCHRFYDETRVDFDETFPDFNPEIVAYETEKAWASSVLDQREAET